MLDCLVKVSNVGTFCWVIIFEIHVDVICRDNQIPKGKNLQPREVFYTKQGLLVPIEIIDGEYTHVSCNIYIFTFISKKFLYTM